VRTLTVELGPRSYPLQIGEGLLAQAGAMIAPLARRAVIVTNALVAQHYLQSLQDTLSTSGIRHDSVVVPDGEAHKTFATLYDIHTRLLELRTDRSTMLIALGGGVIGDLAGFAAATYQRGIGFVQIPTTLLAQVDSSVGGKTGVNHPLGKNMIGAFHQPSLVLLDTSTLSTLPQREFAAGMAEVIKYGAIRDRAFFDWLETNISALNARDSAAVATAVYESCRIKAQIVAADERETGVRAVLNFGHTFGHAIETASGYGTWLHGEAVGMGMVIAAALSRRVSGLASDDEQRLSALVEQAGLPRRPPAMPFQRWLDLMSLDKKVLAGAIRFILLTTLGSAAVRADIPSVYVAAAIGVAGSRSATPTEVL
jgi:3-dehydroquinate synthase